MRVLVVEDERRLALPLKRGLEADGFAVDVAFDGATGLWMAREHRYDAIVLDLMLPGVRDYQICATLLGGGMPPGLLSLDDTEARRLRQRGVVAVDTREVSAGRVVGDAAPLGAQSHRQRRTARRPGGPVRCAVPVRPGQTDCRRRQFWRARR